MKQAIKHLKNIAKQVNKHTVKVGVYGGKMYPTKPISMVELAMIHEFGSDARGIPERSFLRSTLNDNRKKYLASLEESAQKITAGISNADQELGKIGVNVANDVVKKITDIRTPPNSPATIALKGSSNPLIHDGHLKQSISYKVSYD